MAISAKQQEVKPSKEDQNQEIDDLTQLLILSLDNAHLEDFVGLCNSLSLIRDTECKLYYVICMHLLSYQLKLIKMRAELANLNHCAVSFLSRPPNCAGTRLYILYIVHLLLVSTYCVVSTIMQFSEPWIF